MQYRLVVEREEKNLLYDPNETNSPYAPYKAPQPRFLTSKVIEVVLEENEYKALKKALIDSM